MHFNYMWVNIYDFSPREHAKHSFDTSPVLIWAEHVGWNNKYDIFGFFYTHNFMITCALVRLNGAGPNNFQIINSFS